MKYKTIETIILLSIMLLIPAWLYASGNLPISSFPPSTRLVGLMQHSFPAIAEVTYEESHHVYEVLRNYGLTIPYSHNEKSQSIYNIRAEVVRLCDSILKDKTDEIYE